MSWEVKVIRADNGYIVEYGEDESMDGNIGKRQIVFMDEDACECDCPAASSHCLVSTRDMLSYIKEYLGVMRSKHNKKNLLIEITGDEKFDLDTFNHQDILEAMKSAMIKEGSTNEDVAKEIERQIKELLRPENE